MKKLVMKNTQVNKKVATPVGRLLWMHLAEPTPANAPMQPDKYTCTVAWDKTDKTQAVAIKGLVDAILDVARTAYGDNTITIQDLQDNNCLSVIKDGNKMQDYLNGFCVTSASTGSKFPPKVYGPVMSQGELDKAAITKIANGDYGRMVITLSAYKTPAKHGITAYLSLVQFARKGEYLGGGSDGKNLLDDLQVEAVTEDEKALLETLPLQDVEAETKAKTKAKPKAEVKAEADEVKAEEPVASSSEPSISSSEPSISSSEPSISSSEPVTSEDSFNELFNF